ncbi:MAG: hypothetical protein RQ801_11575, partial [Spirochaetaceae bacterium]|nr:hypothetical protein [Spirochaetaceae bacterium]
GHVAVHGVISAWSKSMRKVQFSNGERILGNDGDNFFSGAQFFGNTDKTSVPRVFSEYQN